MFRLINNLRNKKGFTLIELIVVLAVLAIIMAIAVPRFLGVQDKAKVDADESTLKLIAKAAEIYYIQENSVPDVSDLIDRGDIDSGLKYQVENEAISDTNTEIDRNTSTGAITVEKK